MAAIGRTAAQRRGARLVAALMVLGGATVSSVAAPAIRGDQIALAPHRAIYDFTLARASAGSGVTDMSARMVYELTGSPCEGYTQSMRFVTRATTPDGGTSINDLRSSSWEEATGKTFRFNSSQLRDDQATEGTSGDAARNQDEIKIELAKPQKKKTAIAGTALFPIQHSRELLAAAQREESVFEADLYDGSEKGEKVYATTAVIGRLKPDDYNSKLPVVESSQKLSGLKSWPVSLSYFEPGKGQADAVPTYELAFLLFENGIVRNLTLDYGDFALKGDLKALTVHEAPKCEPKGR